jgi:4-hydroxy-tetrahydrodipicolinate synthase
MDWTGVLPAITTPFAADGSVDHAFLREHARWLIDGGCRGVVALGSLGEGGTLTPQEKLDVLGTLRDALGARAPVVAGVAALSTAEAVGLARAAQGLGCAGLMVLPPYVYKGDRRETEAHFDAVIAATPLSCMLYNNPVAYGTDVPPDDVVGLAARHANLHAVKESSTDVRRITALRARLGERLTLACGVDDLIVEGVEAGATSWVAGLVNALPHESVRLFELSRAGRRDEARALYEWFLPLLRLDTVPKFVQLIKLVQEAVGRGSARVRPPRLPLAGDELDEARALVAEALARRPRLG